MFILIERYLDSSRNEYFDTKVFETRKEAVADAQMRFNAFVADETDGWTKQEILESWQDGTLNKFGDFRTGNTKEVWTEKHSIKVTIQER